MAEKSNLIKTTKFFITTIFEKYDFDGNGVLDKDEVRGLIDELRTSNRLSKSNNNLYKSVWGILDINADGDIDKEELLDRLFTTLPLILDTSDSARSLIKK